MPAPIDILQQLHANGPMTYDELDKATPYTKANLYFACNALKRAGHVKQVEACDSNAIAWRITPAGIEHLSKPESRSNREDTPAGRGNVTPAAKAAGTRVAGRQRSDPPSGDLATPIEAATAAQPPAPALDGPKTEPQRGRTIHIDRCPFCGFNDVEITEVEPDRFAIDCPDCQCIGPIETSVISAIDAWNDRSHA